jgi:acyl-CoA dehydrogenase
VERFIVANPPSHGSGAAQPDQWRPAMWQELEATGLPLAALSEERGGVGLGLDDALALLRPLASGSVPLPVGETILSHWLAEKAGIDLGEGVHSFVPGLAKDSLVLSREGQGWTLAGKATRVPWARHAASLLVRAEYEGQAYVARLSPGQWSAKPGQNLAGEPRDDIEITAQLAATDVGRIDDFEPHQWLAVGAAMRSVQMAGAIQRAMDLTVTYVGERSQFGRKLKEFQAVQQNLAIFAGQTASANAAAELGAEAAARGVRLDAIAAAKIRCGEAAKVGSQIAHQLHGAIGFTAEYSLNLSTRRLWSWREEFGGESFWAEVLGRGACRAGGSGLWGRITATTTYQS